MKNIHGNCRGIQLVHRGNPKEYLDRSNHAHRIVKFVNQRAGLVVRADGQAHGTMRIDVVGPRLRIVFHDKNRGVFPIHARRNRFDQPPDRVVVVGNHELRRGKSFLDSRGVVIGKAHHRERGHGIRFVRFALGYEIAKLREPFAQPGIASAVGIRIVLGHRGVRSLRGG